MEVPPKKQTSRTAAQPVGKIEPKQVPADQVKPAARLGQGDQAQMMAGPAQHDKKPNFLSLWIEKNLVVDEDVTLGHQGVFLTCVALFIVFIGWASFATLDEVTRGFGKIIPSSELQEIASLEGGIVESFHVKKGDKVQKGQKLVSLSDAATSSDLESNKARYYGLRAAIIRLEAEVSDDQTVSFPKEISENAPRAVMEELNAFRTNQNSARQQINVLKQQKAQKQQELREAKTKASDLQRVLGLSLQERDMIAPLVEKGSAPRIELVQLERNIQQQRTELNSARNSVPRLESSVDEVDARIKEATSVRKAEAQIELTQKQLEASTLEQTFSNLEDRQARTIIRSPVDGIVNDLRVNTIGGVVQPGQPIIQIVPEGEPLYVEAEIKPSDIAFLHTGQKATVKITAYDFSIFGGLEGAVIDISPDTIQKPETGETFYRVRVKTKEERLERKGEVLPITTGMEAQVDILTGQKTVMEYLLKPFIKTLKQSMNER